LLGPHLVIASQIIEGPKPISRGSIAAANEAEARQAVIQATQDGPILWKSYRFFHAMRTSRLLTKRRGRESHSRVMFHFLFRLQSTECPYVRPTSHSTLIWDCRPRQ
jgi:hypothetical protein